MIEITSDYGRIGRFWWMNGIHSPIEMHNATYMGSVHHVWRPGICGIDSIPGLTPKSFQWRLIK